MVWVGSAFGRSSASVYRTVVVSFPSKEVARVRFPLDALKNFHINHVLAVLDLF
jgi:hypothetical protein